MDQYTRRIIGFGVQAGRVDGIALCRMFNRAIQGQRAMPKYLSCDHDPLYRFEQWQANLRILEVVEIKTVPYACLIHSWSGWLGRFEGSILDRTLFWTSVDLENKLLEFRDDFNSQRTHYSLERLTPDQGEREPRPVANLHCYRW
jgi:putative transposase